MTAIKFLGCCIVIAACYMTGINPGLWYIAVHGIRMVTSQDPHDRDAAKSSIIHVIIALIIIAMAAALVNMFISMGGLDTGGTTASGGTPAPAPSPIECKDSTKGYQCSSKPGCWNAKMANCWINQCTTTGGKSHMYTYTCDKSGTCADSGKDCPYGCNADKTDCALAQTCKDCTGSSCTWDQCKTHAGSESCIYYPGAPLPCKPCSEMTPPLIGDKCGVYALDICEQDPCKVNPRGCVIKPPTLAGGSSSCGNK